VAKKTLRFALTVADIPFVSTQQPRSVVVGEIDSAGKLPREFYGTQQSYDFNTMQVVYAENVMPTAQGWSSVSYTQAVESPVNDLADPAQAALVPVRESRDVIQLTASDPNDWQSVASTEINIPTTSDNLLLLVAADQDHTRLWLRYPLSYTTPNTNWKLLQAYFTDSTIHNMVFGPLGTGQEITTASASGIQFICVPYSGIFFVGTAQTSAVLPTLPTLQYVAVQQHAFGTAPTLSSEASSAQFLANLPIDPQLANCIISSSNGYLLIAWDNVIAWALASGNVFDFAPIANAAVTGSDSRIPEELIGNITCLTPVAGGFIIFSERNAIAAIYSPTNFANPWTFREISGCGGVRNPGNVCKTDSQGSVHAITSAGLQRITLTSVQDVNTACSDFITGRQLEMYDEDSGELVLYRLQADLRTRCTLLGSRYLAASIGFSHTDYYDFALVYDLQFKRWGKFRYQHTAVVGLFDTETPQDLLISDLGESTISDLGEATIESLVTDVSGQYTDYRHQIGLLTGAGELVRAVIDPGSPAGTGQARITFGQFQLSRSRATEMHAIEVEGCKSVSVELQTSYDGRVLEPKYSTDYWMEVAAVDDYAKWAGLVVGVNFTFSVVGTFDMSTILVTGAAEGTL
jgi:hypothetical protein